MGTTMTYKKAITDLVNIYAEVDVLTMEMCAAWLPKAPETVMPNWRWRSKSVKNGSIISRK